MTWMFWRKRKIQEAMGALESTEDAQEEVDNISERLEKKSAQNNFAPMLQKAFQIRENNGTA